MLFVPPSTIDFVIRFSIFKLEHTHSTDVITLTCAYAWIHTVYSRVIGDHYVVNGIGMMGYKLVVTHFYEGEYVLSDKSSDE